eukprot:superscaffoldBa00000525_g5406
MLMVESSSLTLAGTVAPPPPSSSSVRFHSSGGNRAPGEHCTEINTGGKRVPFSSTEHLMKIHLDKADKEHLLFHALEEKHARSTISSLFTRKTNQTDCGLNMSHYPSVSLTLPP